MKTAVYIQDGRFQVVLTPETDFEKSILKMLEGSNSTVQVFHGSFYACNGGWIRQKEFAGDDRSLIIHFEPEKKKP